MHAHPGTPRSVEPPVSGKGKKRRIRLLMIMLAAFLVWAGVTYWDQSVLAESKQDQLHEFELKLQETRQANEQFKWEIERLHDPEYIEQRLYKDLQMSKPDETIYQVNP